MALNIWRFTDGKPGHDSQSIGLCDAIGRLIAVSRFDIEANSIFDCFSHFLLNKFPAGKTLPDPDLIIGAGHGTHFSMLAARKVCNGKIIAIMKPSLPLSFFDFCIIPKHDRVSEKNNIITTSGSLNPIQFNKNKSPSRGLILLGGISKHYHWDNKSIIDQINAVVTNSPDIKWTVADSPRTPISILADVNKQSYENVNTLSFSETKRIDIQKLIFNSGYIWVTRDSISMIYESLSSGATVGLIDLPKKKNNRLETSINDLVKEGYLTLYNGKNTKLTLNSNTVIFNEAQRSAELLLNRGILG